MKKNQFCSLGAMLTLCATILLGLSACSSDDGMTAEHPDTATPPAVKTYTLRIPSSFGEGTRAVTFSDDGIALSRGHAGSEP